MLLTTLCYIEKGDQYLMLHRVKKEHDINKDKWIGVGGKFEDKESPEDCLFREVREETGLTLTSWKFRGIITFVTDRYETEFMHLYMPADFLSNAILSDMDFVRVDGKGYRYVATLCIPDGASCYNVHLDIDKNGNIVFSR